MLSAAVTTARTHRRGRTLILLLRFALISCLAGPQAIAMSAINVPPLEGGIKLKSDSRRIENLTRQHDGDVFTANGISKCTTDTCVGLSSGTAAHYIPENDKSSRPNGNRRQSGTGSCGCRCLPYFSTYREDLGICVDDVHECSLSPFTSGSSSEKIPFVFLPLRGQIIYPSREISFSDIRTPVCAITGSQYLTTNGWMDLRNPIDADFPFRMFRDEGRTFIQWLGDPDLRNKMQGRLILIHLMCRDMSLASFNSTSLKKEAKKGNVNNIYTPCVAFRVNGSPVKYVYNVSEVLFQAEDSINLASTSDGMTTKEYVVIGICSLLLGLIYVASVFLYLHVKKRKMQASDPRSSLDDLANEINYPKNDQVTFGVPVPFTREGSAYSLPSVDHRNSQRSRRNSMNGSSPSMKEEMGIVKSNPLLKHFPNLSDHSGFPSDISNSNSECEDGLTTKSDKTKNIQTSALVHPSQYGHPAEADLNTILESPPSPTQENECLPEENVSIVEDMMNEERLESMRAIANGTVRKKLYFNPAYFEPHLLLSPPPAAIEFLSKIREVIAIAKYKMATKRFMPSLGIIPEEGQAGNAQFAFEALPTADCKGCSPNHRLNGSKKCSNCGDKRNSIERWLESVSVPSEKAATTASDVVPNRETSPTSSSSKSETSSSSNTTPKSTDMLIRRKDISAPKTKPPPIPAGAPKIISHSLKPFVNSVDITSASEKSESKSPQTPNSPITTISVTRHFDGDKIYTFAETGNEIYNNPKFNLSDSPQLSQRSKLSTNPRSKSASPKNRMEVYDQYSNLYEHDDRKRYEMMQNIKQMPDMVYEALTRDYSLLHYPLTKQNSQPLSIPTPDYDSTFEKKIKDIYNSTQSSGPSVPTPDYSTLSRKSLRHYQPDSPVYRRRSPQYLIVDYETDSLERSTTKRKCSNSSSTSPSSNNSSDVSSQPSPSLSTALPLEEEVEVRHTIYDKIDGFRKDGDSNIKKKVAKAEFDAVAARIKYDTPFLGSMTIEVEHEVQSDLEQSTDSDQFEPDTLDRKPKKHSFCDVQNMNAWSEHLKKSQSFVNSADGHVSYASLENMTSLPDFSVEEPSPPTETNSKQLILRSSSSFRSNAENYSSYNEAKATKETSLQPRPSFGSLREIYQSKAQRQHHHQRPKLANIEFNNDHGKILTLEAKHTRRQRQIPREEQSRMPPDVVPPEKNFYDDFPKNSSGWNADNFSGNGSHTDTNGGDTASNHSESTEVTGVSDTHEGNSEFEEIESTYRGRSSSATDKDYSAITSRLNNLRNDYSFNKYLSRKKSLEMEQSPPASGSEPLEPTSVQSSIARSSKSKTSPASTISSSVHKPVTVQAVYRVEVSSPTNGMQIAMGLRDRAKKSKDLKNAWKKFVNLATSKFSPNSSPTATPKQSDIYDKKSTFMDSLEKDEGISSLIDDPSQSGSKLYTRPYGNSYYEQRFGYRHGQELDSGYMSADSAEAYNRRFYERYNFKLMTEKDHIIRVDTIEDNSDGAGEQSDSTIRNSVRKNPMWGCGTYSKDKFQPSTSAECRGGSTFRKDRENYSTEDELYKSPSCAGTSESDEDDVNTEELCESGAESVETHSVLYKNIRKSNTHR